MGDVLYDPHTWIGAIVALFIFSLITFVVLLVAWWWDHRNARRHEALTGGELTVLQVPSIPDPNLEGLPPREHRAALEAGLLGARYIPRRALLEYGDTVEQEPVR